MKRQPGDSFSLSEAVNKKQLANLGGQFLPVPPTLLGVGVANQTPRLTPYFSALLHLRLLFFLRSAANRSVLEAARFSTAVIWVLQNERMGIKQDTAWERVEKESVRLERESWSNKQQPYFWTEKKSTLQGRTFTLFLAKHSTIFFKSFKCQFDCTVCFERSKGNC